MSAIGTSYAAGVAQTSLAAQQTARQQDKTRTDRAQADADFAKIMTERLSAPEDAEDPDAQLPDRQGPGYEQLYDSPPPEVPQVLESSQDAADDGRPASGAIADFHHIDVQA